MARNVTMILAALTVSACTGSWDMQGEDPVEYYSEHPVKNTVETQHMLYTMEFTADQNRLTGDGIEDLQIAVRDIRPEAVETVRIGLAPSQMDNELRKQHITKLLRGMGYNRKLIRFESTEGLTAEAVDLDISYAVAVPPHCPDWRKSPVTNYSNTTQPNFGCASAVNLGLMVADPRDLERGSGDSAPDRDRNAIVIRNYKSGADLGASSSEESSDSSTESDSGNLGITPAQ